MNIILLQNKLDPFEIDALLKSFPQYVFLSSFGSEKKAISKEDWALIEIIYGNQLSVEQLNLALSLRWIHSPSPNLNELCMEEIIRRGNILVTTSVEENIIQIGEFAIGAILAFAKHLFQWQKASRFPKLIWDAKWRDSMWCLNERTLVQIGLDTIGSEIARQAKQMNLRVLGISDHKSFHPYCNKTYSENELHSILPQADIFSFSISESERQVSNLYLRKEELELMREDSILIIIGWNKLIDENAVAAVAKTGKFRGILIDPYSYTPIHKDSPLWDIPDIIITPHVSPYPISDSGQDFRNFVFNLRQHTLGSFPNMRNIVEATFSL